MGSFTYVSVVALLCYAFLFLTMLATQKNRIIRSFILVLCALILWTGGSLFMRSQVWPSVKVWYDISLLGIILTPYAMLQFVGDFLGARPGLRRTIWFALALVSNVVNMATGLLLAAPEVVPQAKGGVSFVYHPTPFVAVLFLITAGIIIDTIILVIQSGKNKELPRQQLVLIIIGLVVMYMGNLLIMIPLFSGIPLDIVAGVVNAFVLFYALCQRRFFKPALLISRTSCYILAVLITVVMFTNLIGPMEFLLQHYFEQFVSYQVVIVAVTFSIATLIIFSGFKYLIDRIFIKEEFQQAESLRSFSAKVSQSLKMSEVLSEMVDVVLSSMPVKQAFVFIADHKTQRYVLAKSANEFQRRDINFRFDNPLIRCLAESDDCLLMQDFKRSTSYRSMWEKEKDQLVLMEAECFVPLKDKDELVGLLLLTGKDRHKGFSEDNLNFLSSLNSVASIAVKNANLYEKAYWEARTDELTGLLNRKYFYEILQEEFNNNQGNNLALMILNVDDFKLYNQLYGNREGDEALQRIARIIRESVGESGHSARYSGKEFAIILPKYDVLAAKKLAENIRQQILDMNKRCTDYALKSLTVSIGISSIPYGASNVTQLLNNVDMAVYQVKRNGKNNIMIYAVGELKRLEQAQEGIEHRQNVYSGYAPTIYALTAAVDTKDHYTFTHSKNVAYYATELAYAYGMNEDSVEIVREAALLHDIGKIGVPENILNKKGKLTDSEYTVMKNHVENAIGIIRHLPSLDYVIPAVIGHHERYDGTGYPRRISGEDIPLAARILCIVDSFDAIISTRAYKKSRSVEDAVAILRAEAGHQFDPQLVNLFCTLVENGTIQIQQGSGPEPTNET